MLYSFLFVFLSCAVFCNFASAEKEEEKSFLEEVPFLYGFADSAVVSTSYNVLPMTSTGVGDHGSIIRVGDCFVAMSPGDFALYSSYHDTSIDSNHEAKLEQVNPNTPWEQVWSLDATGVGLVESAKFY